jgi:hypothetical protein
VQFKVVQTDKKVVPFNKPVEKKIKEIEVALDKILEKGELPEGSIIGKVESITSDQIGEGIQITGSGKTALDPVRVVKSNRGRRRLKNADQRDARILELLKKGRRGRKLLK